MFQGMSANPPESTGPGPSTAPPTGGAPSAAEQAGTDAKAVLKGAARGGTAGAVRAAVKTKTARNVLAAAVAIPMVASMLVTGLLVGGLSAVTAAPSANAAAANLAAEASFENKDDLAAIQTAAQLGGARWEVLAAIQQTAKQRTGGTGPFSLDMAKVNGEITDESANNFDQSAVYLARKLSAATSATVNALPDSSLEVGLVGTIDDKGAYSLKESEAEDAKEARSELKKRYVEAITTLPLKSAAEAAEAIFNGASKLSSGVENKCEVTNISTSPAGNLSADQNQKTYAQAIINQVAAKGMPEKAAIVALATALQESGLQMYWNPHVPGSKELSNGGPEGGRDLAPPRVSYSVGLFQQQVNGTAFNWGTVQDAMNPTKSTDMFLEALLRIPNWQNLPVTVAAQKVQISAFPDHYADDEVTARRLVGELKPTTGSYGNTTTSIPGGAFPGAPTATGDGVLPFTVDGGCLRPASSTMGTGVAGKGDDYPFSTAVIYTPDPWGAYFRECTSFTIWRLNVQRGYQPGQAYPFTVAGEGIGLFGDGGKWGSTLGSKYPVDMTPKPGAVAWWGPNFKSPSTTTVQYGHVGIVGAVNPDGTVVIEEYNFGFDHNYNTRTIPAGDVSGYIHVADIG